MSHQLLLRLLTLCALVLTASAASAPKPNLWITSDLSDPRDRRKGGHPQNDPDDLCSLASLLLSANRFHIEAFVYASNHRVGLADATPFVESTFAAAYAHDVPLLNKTIGGYQPSVTFLRSSINQSAPSRRFDPAADYRDLAGLDTVRRLVDYASKNPVYVLSWGPSTEAAMAVRHCLTTGNTAALENMTIISHWTMSFIAQGTPEKPYKVANCNDDSAACRYLHDTAHANPLVKFVELGSTGQTGIVNGSANYPHFDAFRRSRLGQLFIHSKLYSGKPDQSDGATFWILTEHSPGLAHFKSDGTLDQPTEEKARDLFLARTPALLDELLKKSEAAAGDPFPEPFIAARFTYVYQYLDGRYSIYVPLPATYEIRNSSGELVLHGNLTPGDHKIDAFAQLPVGAYNVKVTSGGLSRDFPLERTAP